MRIKDMIVLEKAKPIQRTSGLMGAGAGLLAGLGLAFLFDRSRGKGRRVKMKDMTLAAIRRRSRKMERIKRKVTSDMQGLAQKVKHQGERGDAADDAIIKARVESEIMGDSFMPKGAVVIDVVDGIVTLRGALDDPERIQKIERMASKVPGVNSVRSYLHLEGTPAPNKAEGLRAGS